MGVLKYFLILLKKFHIGTLKFHIGTFLDLEISAILFWESEYRTKIDTLTGELIIEPPLLKTPSQNLRISENNKNPCPSFGFRNLENNKNPSQLSREAREIFGVF